MLELRSISKRLGSFALTELSAEIQRGEYFVLVGPSGVGKTVLLEIIAGLIPVDGGQVLWCGGGITHVTPERRHFALVYQDYALFEHLSVARNIAYGLAARGVRRTHAVARVHVLAERLGIESLLGRRVESLSGGEQQRVALARALVTEPQILLLDEPLAALDANRRLSLRAELKQLQSERGATFIHVTHDLEEAMSLGDRVGVMLNQRLHQVGTPLGLFRNPSDYEVACFLGMRNVLAVTQANVGRCRACGVEIDVASAVESVRYSLDQARGNPALQAALRFQRRNQFLCSVTGYDPHGSLLAVDA